MAHKKFNELVELNTKTVDSTRKILNSHALKVADFKTDLNSSLDDPSVDIS